MAADQKLYEVELQCTKDNIKNDYEKIKPLDLNVVTHVDEKNKKAVGVG